MQTMTQVPGVGSVHAIHRVPLPGPGRDGLMTTSSKGHFQGEPFGKSSSKHTCPRESEYLEEGEGSWQEKPFFGPLCRTSEMLTR